MHRYDIVSSRSTRHKEVYKQRRQQISAENILDRQFIEKAPNMKWVSGITFIPTAQGFLYLAIVLGLYSRAVVGWSMSLRINRDIVIDALNMAITQRDSPVSVLVHSD